MQCPDPTPLTGHMEGEWTASRTDLSRRRPNVKAEDIAKLSDDDIGRYFAGSFGPGKRRDTIALLRWLASKQAA